MTCVLNIHGHASVKSFFCWCPNSNLSLWKQQIVRISQTNQIFRKSPFFDQNVHKITLLNKSLFKNGFKRLECKRVLPKTMPTKTNFSKKYAEQPGNFLLNSRTLDIHICRLIKESPLECWYRKRCVWKCSIEKKFAAKFGDGENNECWGTPLLGKP